MRKEHEPVQRCTSYFLRKTPMTIGPLDENSNYSLGQLKRNEQPSARNY
jgi:hypothetical protein